MNATRLGLVLAASLAVIGCKGSEGSAGPQGSQGIPGTSVTIASVDPGNSCSAGGTSFTSGGLTAYACNGKTGDQGPEGDPGLAGTSVTVMALGVASACLTGGTQISDGTTTSLACNGAAGPQGLKGDKGDQGIQGIQGVPGAPAGFQVFSATGANLGPAYGIATLNAGYNPAVLSPWAQDTFVLLAEQPLPSGPRVLVWRNAWDGTAMRCNPGGQDFEIYYTGDGCTGDAYWPAVQQRPVPGIACRNSTNVFHLFVATGATQGDATAASYYSGGGCSVGGGHIRPAAAVLDLGVHTAVAAPLRFAPP